MFFAVLFLAIEMSTMGAHATTGTGLSVIEGETSSMIGRMPGARFSQTSKESERSGYWFEMAPARRKDFVNKVKSLALGVTRAEVVKLLGPPDSDGLTGPKKESREAAITGRALTYYAKLWRQGEANTLRDEAITLWFDRETDRLRSLVSSIPEIRNLDSPGTPQ